jgi:tetratricopeptide (TPR) repeat protein
MERDIKKLKALGKIAAAHLGSNDKRVANAIYEAFMILEAQFAVHFDKWEKEFGFSFGEAFDEFVMACLNTAQYHRGLEICALVEKFNLLSVDGTAAEKAEFYGRLGEFKEAENILDRLLQQDPDDIWNYIHYGDLYSHWQMLPEEQDLLKAEKWFYRAFDKKLGLGTEEGEILIERLGEICIERLRRHAETKLLRILENAHIGGWMALEAMKQGIYIQGPDGIVLSHIQSELSEKASDIKQANEYLTVLMDAYNLMPQRALSELCPFQMAEYYSGGEHTQRIIHEKMDAYTKAIERNEVPTIMSAEGAEAFSRFQEEFMRGTDSLTGKKRGKLLEREQRAIEKSIKKGEFLWSGFLRYRDKDSI